MKVVVKYTVTVTEGDRRAMRAYDGREGLATREEIVDWHITHGETLDDEISRLKKEHGWEVWASGKGREEAPDARNE